MGGFAEAVSVVLSFSMAAQQASLFVQQFPVIARYTGASLAVNIAGALGGLAPIVATTLLGKTQGGVTCIAGYVAALAVISVASALRLKESDSADPFVSTRKAFPIKGAFAYQTNLARAEEGFLRPEDTEKA
ncbi:hypothetical protein ACKZDW_25495 [Ralstonia syzygii subsp. celebesensis]